MSDNLREAALDYHRFPLIGKISVTPTKPTVPQRDLALAQSPGCRRCLYGDRARPGRGDEPHLVRQPLGCRHPQRHRGAGLRQHRPAGRQAGDGGQRLPCLFKKFAGFDIELDENDPGVLIDTIARIEPTFGRAKLKDITVPECFLAALGLVPARPRGAITPADAS